ncbi:adenosine deaminase [Novosphingobium sp. AP12]|uniref:adenosine deaminase n=1 Tax=Novosphingobium sp. AP12 TaxID=1144305 RepID=UPI00027223EF|nr:adenosine deaminase [Novosphingobium sp. AP12]EJL29640.1 adenosine deaminase [Novosphingobium sp. AP12]
MQPIAEFIAGLPKAELHVHLEGTLEAELKFELAARNKVDLPYANVEEMRASYVYHDLPSFLSIFYEGSFVLHQEADFRDLVYAYLKKVAAQNVLYAEMFFDPQQHTDRGVPFATMIEGLTRGRIEAERDFGIRSQLIMCFVRERSAESAMAVFEMALPYKHLIVGLGLDSDEKDNPPAKFAEIFWRGRDEGFRLTMHCDVDQANTHEHIRQAIEDIGVERIDHGANLLDRPELIAAAREKGLFFTVCPYANEMMRPGENQSIARGMLDLGLRLTLNSDDPAYMEGKYINENMLMAHELAGFGPEDFVTISRNAFDAAWIDEDLRARLQGRLADYAEAQLMTAR